MIHKLMTACNIQPAERIMSCDCIPMSNMCRHWFPIHGRQILLTNHAQAHTAQPRSSLGCSLLLEDICPQGQI